MKKIKRPIFLILLVIVGSFLCIYGFTFAKYVSNSIWDYYLKSKGFYFSSDYLGSNVVKNVDNLWDGESVPFNIKNNLNQTVMTNYDINYNAVCTIQGDASAHTECRMNGTDSNTFNSILTSLEICSNTSLLNKTDCELGGYNWVNQVVIKDLYFDVVLTDSNYELKDVTVNVTVTSTSPYHKTLSGDFKLYKTNLEEDKITIDYKNYSNYDRLIISNSYSSTKCVKVTWDASKLIVNANNDEFSSYAVDSNGYINEIKFNINPKANLSYIFYSKNFDLKYNVTEFQIEETSGC